MGYMQLRKYQYKYINSTNSKYYSIMQIILNISIILCFLDCILSIAMNKFPLINFILRPIMFIYMIRRIRNNWIFVLKVLWKTKLAFFILFLNIFTFSIIGYTLLKQKDGYFDSFLESILQLYILLSTCNFPDIMLESMKLSNFAIIFYIIYISINYFIVLSLLKNLYTSKYNSIYRNESLQVINNIIENENNIVNWKSILLN